MKTNGIIFVWITCTILDYIIIIIIIIIIKFILW